MSGHGGARPGAGRPKGSGSTATALDRHKLGEMIRQEAPALIRILLDLALNSPDERIRMQTSIALLDRGYGRPPQASEIAEHNDFTAAFQELFCKNPYKLKK